MDPLDETKQHEVLIISAMELRSFGLSPDLADELTPEDMERIALELHERYVLDGFEEDALFVARTIIAERASLAVDETETIRIKEETHG